MYKVGDILKNKWQHWETYVVLDTKSKKAGYSFTTYELFCPQRNTYFYPVERIVQREYEEV